MPVNWCPELGTVLANEEVIDGKSERGGYPVVRMPLTQWMLRITAYAERLIEDLDDVDWPRPIKDMQRNWVGRSEGAVVDFPVGPGWRSPRRSAFSRPVLTRCLARPTWCWRLSIRSSIKSRPTHSVTRSRSIAGRRASKSDLDRTDLAKTKTGVFTGAYAINPVNGEPIPVWIADYVLMGYGTGAIMAVPGHDERDFEFAQTVRPADRARGRTELGPGRRPARPGRGRAGHRRQFAERPKSRSTACPPPRPRPPSPPGWRNAGWEEDDQLQAARLAFLASALLGRAVSGRARRATTASQAIAESELPVRLPELEDFKPTGQARASA